MSASTRHLSERTIGQYPISVGTSLAIESAMGIHPEIEVKFQPIKQYGEFWINLKTLYRNMMGSLQADAAQLVLGVPVGDELQLEMDRIDSIIASESDCQVIYYVCNYTRMDQRYPHARIRVDSTPRQKQFTQTMKEAIQHLLMLETKPAGQQHESRMKVFDVTLKPTERTKTLILTHVPLDLCSYKHFGELALLESHTGAIKEKAQWYTKYLNGKELARIPFREDLLQVFGDHELFHPYPIENRKQLIAVAEKYSWTPLTTTEKIRYTLDFLLNPYLKEKLRAMLVP